MEGDKALGIRRPHWPDMDRAAIAEHDIGFPFRGVVAAAHLGERSEDGATRRPCWPTSHDVRAGRRLHHCLADVYTTSVLPTLHDVHDDAAHDLVVPRLARWSHKGDR